MKISQDKIKNAIWVLSHGGTAVIPTDTIYGIVGSALDARVVGRIARLRRRSIRKPMIVLIADASELSRFGVVLGLAQKRFLGSVWPGKVSVVLALRAGDAARFSYLHRHANTIAFRVPRLQWLRELLKVAGPLVAPSANFEGEPPAFTVRAAKRYFGNGVDCYLDAGRRVGKPSKIVRLEGNSVVVLRK